MKRWFVGGIAKWSVLCVAGLSALSACTDDSSPGSETSAENDAGTVSDDSPAPNADSGGGSPSTEIDDTAPPPMTAEDAATEEPVLTDNGDASAPPSVDAGGSVTEPMTNADAAATSPADAAPPEDVVEAGAMTFDPQIPPTEAVAMARWLDEGYYLDWICEAEPNAKVDGAPAIHAHGAATRVCSNVLLAASTSPGTGGQFPIGVASVKEVYDEMDELIARVVSVKADSESDEGNGWYWYAGPETAGFGNAACTGCHAAAAADGDHPGAGDFVYFQTKNEAQLPPVGDPAAVQSWLDAKGYLEWNCETDPTEKADGDPLIHVHGRNRVCSNDVLALADASEGGWPAGSAAVKELYESGDGGAMIGAVLSLKVGADSNGGDAWYWYAGAGAEGFRHAGCTGCHAAAGSDTAHPGAGDFVYVRETP